MPPEKKYLGQYFTPGFVCDFMTGLLDTAKRKGLVLEPSAGNGAFVRALQKANFEHIKAIEIDETVVDKQIKNLVETGSFVTAQFEQKFDAIIGNPPYIRWKNLPTDLQAEVKSQPEWNKYLNSLCDYSSFFILKSVMLLNNGGELVFITPEYWITTTHTQLLRNYMLAEGSVTELYYLNESPIFSGANVSLIIFKYVKGTQKLPTRVTNVKSKSVDFFFHSSSIVPNPYLEMEADVFFKKDEKWNLLPEQNAIYLSKLEAACQTNAKGLFNQTRLNTVGDIASIANGMVSGLDKAFQFNHENRLTKREKEALIRVCKAKHLAPLQITGFQDYIFMPEGLTETEFVTEYPNFNRHLKTYKNDLDLRYSYGRTLPYWEWAFPRSQTRFEANLPRIYVPCKERVTNKARFRFALSDNSLLATQDVSAIFPKPNFREGPVYLLAWLNSRPVFEWVTQKGVKKGDIVEFSEKPISMIPFKQIDWHNELETELYNRIVGTAGNYRENPQNKHLLDEMDELFTELLGLGIFQMAEHYIGV